MLGADIGHSQHHTDEATLDHPISDPKLSKEVLILAKKFSKTDASDQMQGRQTRQASEQYDQMSANLPEDRVQATRQLPDAEQLGVSNAGVSGADTLTPIPDAAKKLKSEIKVKPSAGVELGSGKMIGGVSLGANASVASVAGAETFSTTDDRSRSPYSAGGFRPDSRYSKKIADKDFAINNAVCEQVKPTYDESKALYESPDDVQGYNGRKKFTTARGKKNTGSDPHSLLYFRSADFIDHDERVYTCGQVLDSIVDSAGYPTYTWVPEDTKLPASQTRPADGYVPAPNYMRKSNYSLDRFHITLANGHISGVHFTETMFNTKTTRLERDVANMNWQVDANNVTASIIRLQTELGRETTEKWSPLGYVIVQPYQFNMLYHDIEATTGAIAATAYRSAVTSLAMQLNMLGKDGANSVTPAVRAFISGFADVSKTSDIEGIGIGDLFANNMVAQGAATGLIKMFDSTSKYKSKASFLTAQRSLKYFLSAADNNIDVFHAKPTFLKMLNQAHTFSTMDGQYNPALPVYRTKKIRLVNPLSLNFFLENWVNPHTTAPDGLHDAVTGTYSAYHYSYSDIRNTYVMPVKHPIVEGLMKWLLEHENALATAFGANATIDMPATFDMADPSLFQFIMCAAMEDIALKRNQFFKDIIFAGEQSTYIWDDLEDMKTLDPLFSTQMTIGRYDQGLKIGRLTPAMKIRMAWPEHFMQHGEQVGDGADFLCPWYFNEGQFVAEPGSRDDGYASCLADTETADVMTMPSVRDGVRHEYVDLLYSVSEADLRLSLDRMVTCPVPMNTVTDHKAFVSSDADPQQYVPYGGSYTPDVTLLSEMHLNAVRYDLNSDGRVMVTYDNNIPVAALFCVPRELGFLELDSPALSPVFKSYSSSGGVVYKDAEYVDSADTGNSLLVDFDGSTCFKLRAYQALGDGTPITKTAISQTAALQQAYTTFYAARFPDLVTENEKFAADVGYTPTLSALLSAGSTTTLNEDEAVIQGVYALNSSGAASGVQSSTFVSFVKAFYGIMNRVFFATNPFENCLVARTSASEPNAGVYIDPMEAAYFFGVSGSLASDFHQAVLARLDEYDELGVTYLADTFIQESLLSRAD